MVVNCPKTFTYHPPQLGWLISSCAPQSLHCFIASRINAATFTWHVSTIAASINTVAMKAFIAHPSWDGCLNTSLVHQTLPFRWESGYTRLPNWQLSETLRRHGYYFILWITLARSQELKKKKKWSDWAQFLAIKNHDTNLRKRLYRQELTTPLILSAVSNATNLLHLVILCTYQWYALPPIPRAYAPISGMPYLQYLGLNGGLVRNWHVQMKQAHLPGAQTWVPCPYIPVMHSAWQGDMGICGIHKNPKKIYTQ